MNNNFFDEDLLNQKDTITYERKKRTIDNIESFLNEKMNNEKAINEAYKNQEQVLREEVNLSIKEGFSKKEDENLVKLNEETENILNESEELFKELLAETVIRSLNINEKLIEHNREEISEKVKGFYEMFKEDIDLEASQYLVDLVDKCKKCSSSFDIELRDSLFEEVDNIALIIKEKVANVIEEEKMLSELEIMKEEQEFKDPTDIRLTLFKEMEMENVKLALKESNENNRNLDKNTIMLMSFYETVLDYTLLETFNTLKMLKFETEMYNDQSRKRLIDYNIK